ncbi:MAG: OsmC family protein [Candidatus Eisenbacteria bacterium]
MGVEIRFHYVGDLRCESTHTSSGTELHTDAPVDNQGRGESFSPTDLVATALGSCMLTTMGIAAKARGFDLPGATATVTKEMVADPFRRVGALHGSIQVPGQFSPDQKRLLEAAAESCPVAQSLSPKVDVRISIEWVAGGGQV